MNFQTFSFRKRNRNRKRQFSYILSAIFYLLVVPSHLRAEDSLFPIFPSGYLSTFDQSVFISGSRGTYLGSTDEDGNFIALGNRGSRSAFGRINEDGTVIILYSPTDQDP